MVFIAQVSGVHKDGLGKETRVQEDPCRELGSAHPAAHAGQGALNLTVFPPEREHRVMGAASINGMRGNEVWPGSEQCCVSLS